MLSGLGDPLAGTGLLTLAPVVMRCLMSASSLSSDPKPARVSSQNPTASTVNACTNSHHNSGWPGGGDSGVSARWAHTPDVWSAIRLCPELKNWKPCNYCNYRAA